ncbi:MAG: YceI family protein [Bacteroidetes bacterium]|nr:YceI family protein [Bacteroidota bacterium]MBM3425185.1 YceI family protein [Bacteroidota bacterium]
MKNHRYWIIYVALFLTATSLCFAPTGDYEVTEGHSIAFKSADPSGKFTDISGDVTYSSDNPTAATFNLKIPVNTISTGNGLMNKKALTKEWFEESTYPNMKFKSTSVTKDEKGELQIKGDLTVKGITKEYTIPAAVSGSATKYTFKGTFYVNRLDFKVGKKSQTVPDKMKVVYELPVSQKVDKK